MSTAQSLRALPKVQLHCHLEGTVRAQTFAELASCYGVSTEYRPKQPAARETPAAVTDAIYDFEDFQGFLFKFAAVCRCLQQPTDYARILREYAEDAASNGVMYAELLVSPAVWRFFHPELKPEEVFEQLYAAAEEIEAKRKLPVRFICDLTRNFGVDIAMETVALAQRMRKYGVLAVGLGGDEVNFPASLFEQPFAQARTSGMHVVAHAGEAAGAQSVHDAITILGAERIGHGIHALESPAVVRLLKERDVTLEVCPSSNFATGVAPRDEVHPLVRLDGAGIALMIDTDDPAIFETDISAEYAYVAGVAGLESLLRFAQQAVTASFAPAQMKEKMASKVARGGAELLGARRS